MMREAPEQRRRTEIDQDKLSNLPRNVIDQILSHLPFRDAARTSVLSRVWRYKWAELPYLDIQCSSWPFPPQGRLDSTKFASIVDHVLLLHRGPILKFKYDNFRTLDESAMDRWIMHLARSPIKELELTFSEFNYCVPSCLFSCQSLTHLLLRGSTIKLPSTFKGFVNLKSLQLSYQTIAKDELERLISRCPVLERLTLNIFVYRSHVTVSAPNLLFFSFEGNLRGISFENTPRLADVCILLDFEIDQDLQSFGNYSNLLNFCVQLPMIRKLEINSSFLKYLAAGFGPGELPILCATLDSLTLRIELNSKEDSSRAACVLSVFPNLLDLRVEAEYYADGEFDEEKESNIWEENCPNFRFNKLQYVYINGISRTQGPLDFAKFILSISPVLEQMVVNPDYGVDEPKLADQLSSFRRASGRARVILPD